MELEFISFSDPSEAKSIDSRRRVRSHVMHHVRHRQRLANRRSNNYQAFQPTLLPQQVPRIPPRSIKLLNPSLDNEIEEVEQDVDIGGAERMEQLEVYPVSPTERYISTVFHHCKSL